MDASATRQAPTMRLYITVWIGLMVVVGAEVFLAYSHLSTAMLLASLLVLAFFEAGIALLFFMHLRYERAVMLWWIVPLMLFVFVMMDHFWPDALRMNTLRLH
jgi:cytochrome c oxidase subunit IV